MEEIEDKNDGSIRRILIDGKEIDLSDFTDKRDGEHNISFTVKSGDENKEFRKHLMNPKNSFWLDDKTGNKYSVVTGEYLGNIEDDE